MTCWHRGSEDEVSASDAADELGTDASEHSGSDFERLDEAPSKRSRRALQPTKPKR